MCWQFLSSFFFYLFVCLCVCVFVVILFVYIICWINALCVGNFNRLICWINTLCVDNFRRLIFWIGTLCVDNFRRGGRLRYCPTNILDQHLKCWQFLCRFFVFYNCILYLFVIATFVMHKTQNVFGLSHLYNRYIDSFLKHIIYTTFCHAFNLQVLDKRWKWNIIHP